MKGLIIITLYFMKNKKLFKYRIHFRNCWSKYWGGQNFIILIGKDNKGYQTYTFGLFNFAIVLIEK